MNALAKRLLDLVLSGFGLIASAPLWGLFAAAITLEDGGPVFYRQQRVGRGGSIFDVVKFRSMIVNAEDGLGAIQAQRHDPRVTRVGRGLRATAMDELPQLWISFRGTWESGGQKRFRRSRRVEARNRSGQRQVDVCATLR